MTVSTTSQPTQDQKKKSFAANSHPKRTMAIIIFIVILLLIGFIWLWYWFVWGQFEVYTEDAYVNGNLVQLMSQVSGKVIEVNTDDTYLVKKGQLLIRLDPTNRILALQQAEINLALTVRQVRQLFEDAERIQAILTLRKADLLKAQLDFNRRLGLVGERAISREELQHYQTQLKAAQAQYSYALHNLRYAQSAIENTHLYTHPLVEHAKNEVKIAYLNWVRTAIVAPVTGYVAKRAIQVGQSIAVNTPLLAIVPLTQVWVDANYKESQLSDLRMGQPVTLSADARSDVTYHGKIIGLNAGTGAAFSLLPPQNATGNWIKILQRLPVRVSLQTEEIKKYPLQIGLSMRVTTDVHDLKGNRLAKRPMQKTLYVTDVYSNQLMNVNRIINAILLNISPDMYYPKFGS